VGKKKGGNDNIFELKKLLTITIQILYGRLREEDKYTINKERKKNLLSKVIFK